MTRRRITSRLALVRLLGEAGFTEIRNRRHPLFRAPDGRSVTVPRDGRELPPGTVHSVLRRAGLLASFCP